ncbi:hypothetical protein ACPC54_18285 [Kitasatospora sp. NPDC094028]
MITATAAQDVELLTPTGARLTVRPETDWRHGLAVYTVAETAGSFTLTPNTDTNGQDGLTLNYGRPLDYDIRHGGSASQWDDRPVVNGMELAGATGIDLPVLRQLLAEPAHWAGADWTEALTAWPKRAYPLPSARPFERNRVTECAYHRTAAIVAALVRHHLTRGDLAALDLARRAAQAPLQIRTLLSSRAATEGEIARRQRQLVEYDERIAGLEALVHARGPLDTPPPMS